MPRHRWQPTRLFCPWDFSSPGSLRLRSRRWRSGAPAGCGAGSRRGGHWALAGRPPASEPAVPGRLQAAIACPWAALRRGVRLQPEAGPRHRRWGGEVAVLSSVRKEAATVYKGPVRAEPPASVASTPTQVAFQTTPYTYPLLVLSKIEIKLGFTS